MPHRSRHSRTRAARTRHRVRSRAAPSPASPSRSPECPRLSVSAVPPSVNPMWGPSPVARQLCRRLLGSAEHLSHPPASLSVARQSVGSTAGRALSPPDRVRRVPCRSLASASLRPRVRPSDRRPPNLHYRDDRPAPHRPPRSPPTAPLPAPTAPPCRGVSSLFSESRHPSPGTLYRISHASLGRRGARHSHPSRR